jgi:hypothetical protein
MTRLKSLGMPKLPLGWHDIPSIAMCLNEEFEPLAAWGRYGSGGSGRPDKA